MDRFSFLIDAQHRYLLIGIVLLVSTTVFTVEGVTLAPRQGLVYRSKEPKRFWWNVITYFLAGLFAIGMYLYQSD